MKKDYRVVEPRLPSQLEYERAQFPEVDFTSITKRLSQLSDEHRVLCPKCGGSINFNAVIEWYGPSHFTCTHCLELVHVRRIQVTSEK
ncbi:MAG: hypothetical protein ACFFED_12890 [Candidatus Thorarchaeota archaeon]